MFANRFTALVDACALVSALGRNTILSCAEAELFRVRWSAEILTETEHALARIFAARQHDAPEVLAACQVSVIRRAFLEALVDEYSGLEPEAGTLPDAGDAISLRRLVNAEPRFLLLKTSGTFPLQ